MVPPSVPGRGATLLATLLALATLAWSPRVPPEPCVVPEPCVIIVHPDNPRTDITAESLTRILRAEQQHWEAGAKIYLVLPQTETLERRVVLKQVYRMDEKEFKKYWTHLLYRNKIAALPRTEAAATAISDFVAKRDDAIAVVPLSAIPTGPKAPKVKLLTIDGKSPGDKDYLLRDDDK